MPVRSIVFFTHLFHLKPRRWRSGLERSQAEGSVFESQLRHTKVTLKQRGTAPLQNTPQ